MDWRLRLSPQAICKRPMVGLIAGQSVGLTAAQSENDRLSDREVH
jgi:hypothetical protein